MTVSADGWHRACEVAALPPGALREVDLPGSGRVLLAHGVSGPVACAADCPHQDSPLCDGALEGDVLICPIHFWQWRLPSGEPMGLAELPLAVHPLAVRDGAIWVKLP